MIKHQPIEKMTIVAQNKQVLLFSISC